MAATFPISAYDDPQVAALKVPPHSAEAEQSVIGGLLVDNQAFDRVADVIKEEDFYRLEHRVIYGHIVRLIEKNQPADVVTVNEAIKSAGLEGDVPGGLPYMNSLAIESSSGANIRRYAELVRDRAILRRLISTADEIASAAFNPQGRDTREILDDAEARMLAISEARSRGQAGFNVLGDVIAKVVQRVGELYDQGGAEDVTGVATGFTDLDKMTAGLQPGDLIIVAGRPSMGKAQPLDVPVLTLEGWKAMGNLKLGDALASVDGAASHITGIFPQGERQVFRVTFEDGRSTECCAEHLWPIRRNNEPVQVLDTATLIAELAQGTELRVPAFDGQLHREARQAPVSMKGERFDGWMLGALWAHGHRVLDGLEGPKEWATALATDMATATATDLPSGADAQTLEAQGPGAARQASREIRRIVAQAADEGSLRGHVRTLDAQMHRVLHNPARLARHERLDLVRGMLDAQDGPLDDTIAATLQELIRSLGAVCHRDETSLRVRGLSAEASRLFTSQEAQQGVASTVCFEEGSADADLRIVAIEPGRRCKVQCIQVSHPTHRYIAEDFIVTHNTAFSLNIAEHVAVNLQMPVAVFSMEMGDTQLAMRILCSIGKLDAQRLRTGRLSEDDWSKLMAATQRTQDAQLYIDETPALSAIELRSRARRLARTCKGMGLIVVDYLQLMSSTRPGENRAAEVSEISRALKGLAKELNCPVIALSQLNRALEQRADKRPMISDLRESGAIEQDADVIMFIYRDEVYNPESQDKGLAEIIIGKQRNGPTGKVKLTFLGQYTRFENSIYGTSGLDE